METEPNKDMHSKQMQAYVAGCQAFFEKCLVDLVLRQPTDPHAFLVETLTTMSQEETREWTRRMGKIVISGERPPTRTTSSKGNPPVPDDQAQVQVLLRLSLMPGEKVKKTTLQVLEDLRRNAKAMDGCMHFEIYTGEEQEIVLLQTWESQRHLDEYHSAPFFAASTGKFSGLLADQPVFKVYKHHVTAGK